MARLNKLSELALTTGLYDIDEMTTVRTLRLKDNRASEFDDGLADFTSLTSLDCSGIPIASGACLPPNLIGLMLNGCSLTSDLLYSLDGPKLRSLSMAFCNLESIPKLSPSTFPRLCNLDLAGNDLCDLDSLCTELSGLDSLTALVLEGNPIMLLPSYRGRVSSILPITTLDEVPITESDTSLPGSSSNAVTLQVNIESVTGIPASVLEHGWTEVSLIGTTASAPLSDPQPELEVVLPVKGKKAGGAKKGVEEPPAPSVPIVPKRTLNLSLDVSVALRDAVLFNGMQVRICTPQDPDCVDEGFTVVSESTVPLRSFAESASRLGAIHELLQMKLAPEYAQKNAEAGIEEEGQTEPVLKMSLILNPTTNEEEKDTN